MVNFGKLLCTRSGRFLKSEGVKGGRVVVEVQLHFPFYNRVLLCSIGDKRKMIMINHCLETSILMGTQFPTKMDLHILISLTLVEKNRLYFVSYL